MIALPTCNCTESFYNRTHNSRNYKEGDGGWKVVGIVDEFWCENCGYAVRWQRLNAKDYKKAMETGAVRMNSVT